MRKIRIGFLVNPIAGMGGAVGLKGTDGELYQLAMKLGAKPIAPERASRFIKSMLKLNIINFIDIITVSGNMGSYYLKNNDIPHKIILNVYPPTTRNDTKMASDLFLKENIDLIIFVGGDGTAKDIYDVIDLKVPVIGVPSGVKMYSSVFAINPEAAAETLKFFIEGKTVLSEREVMDIDEDAYRRDELKINLYGYLKVPIYERFIQAGKEVMFGYDIEENKRAIAKYVIEEMDPNTLYILGPGTTTKTIANLLNQDKTLLGVDAYYNKKLIKKDIAEKDILNLLTKYHRVKLIVSPLGGEGFIFGRGNQQLSPAVLAKIGKENIIVVATRDKIRRLNELYVDTGDPKIDNMLKGYIRVIVDYREEIVMKVN